MSVKQVWGGTSDRKEDKDSLIPEATWKKRDQLCSVLLLPQVRWRLRVNHYYICNMVTQAFHFRPFAGQWKNGQSFSTMKNAEYRIFQNFLNSSLDSKELEDPPGENLLHSALEQAVWERGAGGLGISTRVARRKIACLDTRAGLWKTLWWERVVLFLMAFQGHHRSSH